jgi:hypothetical protein
MDEISRTSFETFNFREFPYMAIEQRLTKLETYLLRECIRHFKGQMRLYSKRRYGLRTCTDLLACLDSWLVQFTNLLIEYSTVKTHTSAIGPVRE